MQCKARFICSKYESLASKFTTLPLQFVFRMRDFEEEDAITVAQLEAGVRCKWSWSWLKLDSKSNVKEVEYVFPLSKFFKKIDKPGHARCSLCCKEINYSTKGSHALLAHCKTEKHTQKVVGIMTTRSILVSTTQGQSQQGPSMPGPSQQSSSMPGPSQQSSSMPGPEQMRERVKVPVPLFERVANAEVSVG